MAATADLDASLATACRALLSHQRPGGYFDGDVDQGTAPTAQVLIVERFLGVLDPGDAADAARWLLGRAQPDGGFLAYPHATFSTLTETCCAYAALVAAGLDDSEPRLTNIRRWIEARGGFRAADPITQCF